MTVCLLPKANRTQASYPFSNRRKHSDFLRISNQGRVTNCSGRNLRLAAFSPSNIMSSDSPTMWQRVPPLRELSRLMSTNPLYCTTFPAVPLGSGYMLLVTSKNNRRIAKRGVCLLHPWFPDLQRVCSCEGVMPFLWPLSHNSAPPPLNFCFQGTPRLCITSGLKAICSAHSVDRDGSHQDRIILDFLFLRGPSHILPQPRCLKNRGQQSL